MTELSVNCHPSLMPNSLHQCLEVDAILAYFFFRFTSKTASIWDFFVEFSPSTGSSPNSLHFALLNLVSPKMNCNKIAQETGQWKNTCETIKCLKQTQFSGVNHIFVQNITNLGETYAFWVHGIVQQISY